MSDDLLLVTSFSPDLYAATGKELLASCDKHMPDTWLLVCTEGALELPDRSRRFQYRLAEDKFLCEWLAANRDVIPDYLGGLALECQCPERRERHGKHKPGCHWQWMNRNASRWFRKVVAYLKAAALAAQLGLRRLLWLDSDARFVKPLPAEVLDQAFAGAAVCYCQGHRPAAETGVLGVDLAAGGKRFLKDLRHQYSERHYLRHERWDDGYQTSVVIRAGVEAGRFTAHDLVHPTRWKGVTNHVLPKTLLAPYIEHAKGSHGRILNIMK